jgi:hypothetical protein
MELKERSVMKRVGKISILTGLSMLLALLLGLRTTSWAGDRSGTVSEEFLKLPLSARAVGMGGADVAVAFGATSLGYNAAGIMSVSDNAFGATYSSWLANIQYSFAGAVKNIPGFGAVGVSVTALSTDDMIETTPAYPEGDGLTFRASDYAFGIAFARQVTEQFAVGVNAKIIQSYLYNTQIGASSFAFDIGTLYDVPQLRSRLGVSLTNIGKDIQFIDEAYALPTALRFGILTDIVKTDETSFVATLEINRVNDADEQFNTGVEYTFNNILALRAGYKFAYDQENYTAGFGIKMNDFLGVNGSLDYGYNNFVYLPGTHTFTLELQF